MYYFAYGSNLSREQMSARCPDSEPRFVAALPNHRLIFTGWSRQWRGGVASIKPLQGKKVVGAVYEISERDLRLLDKFEGYPANYDRVTKRVITEGGQWLEVVTYIKRQQSEETEPSRNYLTLIQQGYRDWGIT
jgi:gamma-glutamylcyclotransferase (GGCT)/AIG2-like uncharacterized protein YtfP